jgi:hypothetical protein
MTTDGLTECPGTVYANPLNIKAMFENCSNEDGVLKLLTDIQKNKVRDSTTIISWMIGIDSDAMMPSDQ